MSRRFWFYLCILLFAWSCRSVQRNDNSSPPDAANVNRQQAAKPAADLQTDIPEPFKTSPVIRQAWLSFAKDNSCRLMRPNDFRIPEWAMKIWDADLRAAINNPVVARGDLNGDDAAPDFMIMVADTSREDDARFGIVIFDALKAKEGEYKTYWLYRDRDLSRSILSRASTSTFVVEFTEDGKRETCYVNWDKKKQEYACDKISR